MQTFLSIQHWLYSGMGEGLGAIAGGDPRAILLAMAAAILFGAVHPLMPGHGKTVLVSYHLGQEARPLEGFVNGLRLWRQDAANRVRERRADRSDWRVLALALAKPSPSGRGCER